ncbi:MAG: GFA family protein [Rhizomicrobium sp.]
MIEASCHCGAVTLQIDTAPETVKDCNCSVCRRYGTLWAYYRLDQVRVTPKRGATDIYTWVDREIEIHRCKICGCVAYWWPAGESVNRMGVNANLMPREVLEKATVLPFDGASM